MTDGEGNGTPNQAPITLSHTADFYRRYLGEDITFYTRVEIAKPVTGFAIRINIPHSLQLVDYRPCFDLNQGHDEDYERLVPIVEQGEGVNVLVWRVEEPLSEGTICEYQAEVKVLSSPQNVIAESRAIILADMPDSVSFRAEDMATIVISAQSAYLKYLPGIYQKDELMGRFLMLFESFLAPVEEQLDNLPFYFDPALAPADLLPWLASWLNLVLDEHWAEDKRRQLLQAAIHLYRQRGTKAGLQKYLEIYTGQSPQIIEYRANNFQLGSEARLGRGIAFGTANQPHTFKVVLRLPPVSAADEAEIARQTQERRQTIETIIETEKPAHTAYILEIETAHEEIRVEGNGR